MKIGFGILAGLLMVMAAPSMAADQVARPVHRQSAAVENIFLHNYGPPDFYPGTVVPPDQVVVPVAGRPYGLYDGFDRHCGQSTANYIGQDGRRHPCN